MSLRSALAGVLLFALAAEARAEPPGLTPPARKSPANALLTSLGVTAAGAVVIAAGSSAESGELAVAGGLAMFIGPSVGRWYAGAREGTLIGLGARVAALGVALHALNEDTQPVDSCDPELDDCTAHDAKEAEQDRKVRRLYIAAAALWIGSTAWDIVRAPLDAREHNRAHGFAVAPTLMGDGAGLVLGGSF